MLGTYTSGAACPKPLENSPLDLYKLYSSPRDPVSSTHEQPTIDALLWEVPWRRM